ncbi:box C/D snoRNA protein 1 isoform X2 [Anthonomus grandis grandis]|uniref:box C/D snoRNA protein 1 isoform X2 n=1 Tax=Anthonomus grandis grandis TaxID=2921223 RepID=UPI002165B918|nr:box C/D snoRNA protein 1 isoform X2 [Anthonomus grandis grandis]
MEVVPSCSSDVFSAAPSETLLNRLGKCEVCDFHNAKYTCPKCEVKTCSLRCNKIHKLEVECDGNRDKTKYLAINKFSNMDLESDYRLLENISESMQTIKKKFGKRNEQNVIPPHLFKLRNAAKQRTTTLKFLPYKFVRHRTNTTQLNFKTNIISWHIEWVFVNADNLRICDSRVPETEKLGTTLTKHLLKQEDPLMQEKMQFYQSADLSGLQLFLKAEQKSGKKFFELDYNLSIKENLAKKLIIEYPTIHVLLKDHGCGYEIIDSDDEDGDILDDIRTGNEVVEQILNRAESDDSLYNSLKNLLFISEYSDEEKN